MRVVINDSKTGASFQREVPKERESVFYGKKIGDVFDGGIVGLDGYKLQITGGSTKDGVPMRADIPGQKRVTAVLAKPPGVRGLRKGQKLKKSVAGNTVSLETAQLNAVIKEFGSKTLSELGFEAKKKEKKEKESEKKEEEKKAEGENKEEGKK